MPVSKGIFFIKVTLYLELQRFINRFKKLSTLWVFTNEGLMF